MSRPASPFEFRAELERLGFLFLVKQTLRLNHSELDAFDHLWSARGAVVTFGALANDPLAHPISTGTKDAIRKRIERLRAKLADVGIENVIKTETPDGYSLPAPCRQRLFAAFAEVFGVSEAA